MTTYVSGNFFEGLGLKPLPGGSSSAAKERRWARTLVVLGYDYWKQKFDSDPSVAGRTVTLDGHPVTIVGVAPKDFAGMQSYSTMAAYCIVEFLSPARPPIP